MRDSPLKLVVYRRDWAVHAVLDGRLVIENSAALRRAVEGHLSSRVDQLALCLAEVTFIDSSGLGVLVGLKIRCAGEKVKFLIVSPSPALENVFAVARLNDLLEVVRGPEAEALRAAIEIEDALLTRHEFAAEPSPNAQSGVGGRLAQPALWSGAEPAGPGPETQARAFCKKAMDSVRDRNFEEAIELYRRALDLEPRMLSALNNLAVVYEKKPVWTMRAIETWEKVLELSRQMDDDTHRTRAERRLVHLHTRITKAD